MKRKNSILKIRNKVLSLFLILVFVLSMTACGKEAEDGQPGTVQTDESKQGTQTENKINREEVLAATAGMLLESTPQPSFGSVGGEWLVFGLSRWGGEVPEEWYESYYQAVETYVQECNGVLDERKYTEYSRVILTLTAIGKDPADVGGHNLLTPLADFEQTIFQGLNGPAYALMALDSGNYEIPQVATENTQATREMYVDYILEKETEGGGWSLTGGAAEADITAMVLQALAKYKSRQDVSEAIDRALNILSEQQNEDGGYIAYEAESSETIAQVIVALTELGISIEDERFVKNGHTLEDRLYDFMTEDHGFKHVMDGESNMIATEQAFYALVSLERVATGQTSLHCIKPIV